MTETISLDELKAQIGGAPRFSSWYVVDQGRIDKFSDVTEDWQFIHVDAGRAARETPFGGTIAHGFLTLSMLSAMTYEVEPMIEGAAMGINYGFNRIRFINPVPAGARIRAQFTTLAVEEKTPERILTTTGVTVEIENGEKPALTAEWLGMTVLG